MIPVPIREGAIPMGLELARIPMRGSSGGLATALVWPLFPFSGNLEQAGFAGLFGVTFAVAMQLVNQSGPPNWLS